MEVTDKRTTNEIDHCLINDFGAIKKYTILNQFDFSSDRRPSRASLYLTSKAKTFKRFKVEKKDECSATGS